MPVEMIGDASMSVRARSNEATSRGYRRYRAEVGVDGKDSR